LNKRRCEKAKKILRNIAKCKFVMITCESKKNGGKSGGMDERIDAEGEGVITPESKLGKQMGSLE